MSAVLVQFLLDTLSYVPTPSPTDLPTPSDGDGSGSSGSGGGGSGFAPYATLVGAIIAAIALVFVNVIQKQTANRNLTHLQSVADNNDTRAHAEGLAKRYQEAASQIGHDRPAVRMAGVYALARLADDWPEQRQTCVDVLCAVLRMRPTITTFTSEDGYPFDGHDDGDMQVRRTVVGLVSNRVSGRGALWAACDFNLAGSYIADFKLRNAILTGKFIINDATLDGVCEFTRIRFEGGLDARNLRIEGRLSLTDVRPGQKKTVALSESFIASSGTLDFVLSHPPSADQTWGIWPNGIRCAGLFTVKVPKTPYEQAAFHIPSLQLLPSGTFRAVPIPVGDAACDKTPHIEAKEWMTATSSTIDMPRSLRRKHVFNAQAWTGSHKTHFEHAYAPGVDIDELLDVD